MTKKQKITLVCIFATIVIIVAVVAGFLNAREAKEGTKSFQVQIISQRDDYSEVIDCKSEAAYLGEFLRTFEGCEWEESQYGIFIHGFYGMLEDMDQQYWWLITVNGESATVGADEIPLQDGDQYLFTLMQGY